MCGRFTQAYTWRELCELYRLTCPPVNTEPRYNIAPTTTIHAVVPHEAGRDLLSMRWGLIPSDVDTGERLRSCTIIVTAANALTRSIHDRMPVLIEPRNFGPWLSGEAGTGLLRSAPDDYLRLWTVSKRVNRTGNVDNSTLIEEISLSAA